MQRTILTSTALLLALVATECRASGIGASYFVPGKAPVVPNKAPSAVVQACCESCGPVASCPGCQRLGFACVDHATPPPCTAEGGCYPARESFGYYPQRWRRWPGSDYEAPAPELAVEGEDSLLPSFDPPAAEEEDQRAPPPIEDVDISGADEEEGFDQDSDAPGLEINLPPLPEPGGREGPRPAAPRFREGPPELPFGFRPANEPTREGPEMIDANRWRVPPPPFSTRPAGSADSEGFSKAAPPLPTGLKQASATSRAGKLGGLRRGRYDAAVRPVAAVERLPVAR